MFGAVSAVGGAVASSELEFAPLARYWSLGVDGSAVRPTIGETQRDRHWVTYTLSADMVG